jgi:hypothetical protein
MEDSPRACVVGQRFSPTVASSKAYRNITLNGTGGIETNLIAWLFRQDELRPKQTRWQGSTI